VSINDVGLVNNESEKFPNADFSSISKYWNETYFYNNCF
jgi:hypothetical protein